MRRKLKFVLFGFLVLITLVALAWAVENWRGYHAWKKYRQEWEAKGEVFEMAKLIPPGVPEEKNFAMTPLLKPLLQYTIGSNFMVWLDTNGLERVEHTGAGLRAGSNKQPEPGERGPGEFCESGDLCGLLPR